MVGSASYRCDSCGRLEPLPTGEVWTEDAPILKWYTIRWRQQSYAEDPAPNEGLQHFCSTSCMWQLGEVIRRVRSGEST